MDDAAVLWDVRQTFGAEGRAPTVFETAERLGAAPHEVEAALVRLGESRQLVLLPGTTQVWMSMPFSAVPTPYPAQANGRTYYGNCAWNAFGVLALLGLDGRVEAACADCGEPLAYEIRDGKVSPAEGVMHLLVPRARWYDDIGFT